MENILAEYLQRSFPEEGAALPAVTGPVVTFSREFGCPSKPTAQLLVDTINRQFRGTGAPSWKFISKEVVENAARDLEMHPSDLHFMLSTGARGLLSDVLASFTYSYVSSHRMKKTIRKVITELATIGHMVIVGRGGAGVLHGYPSTLHVRLQAPMDWRIREICRIRGLTRDEAVKLAEETDEKRRALIELVSGVTYSPYLFDLIMNCNTLSMADMADTVISLMKSRKLLP